MESYPTHALVMLRENTLSRGAFLGFLRAVEASERKEAHRWGGVRHARGVSESGLGGAHVARWVPLFSVVWVGRLSG